MLDLAAQEGRTTSNEPLTVNQSTPGIGLPTVTDPVTVNNKSRPGVGLLAVIKPVTVFEYTSVVGLPTVTDSVIVNNSTNGIHTPIVVDSPIGSPQRAASPGRNPTAAQLQQIALPAVNEIDVTCHVIDLPTVTDPATVYNSTTGIELLTGGDLTTVIDLTTDDNFPIGAKTSSTAFS
ncbi:MAG: hypothetical protein Q9170_003332 [Blastenia crenularia]